MTLPVGGFLMTSKISLLTAIALAAIVAAPSASYAASKKSQSDQQSQSELQRGPYTPDIKTTPHGASRDFQGGSQYYKKPKTHKHHSPSPGNS
jgi:Ni/Co efflux regulator RcnB